MSEGIDFELIHSEEEEKNSERKGINDTLDSLTII